MSEEKTWAEVTRGLVSKVLTERTRLQEEFVARYLQETGLSITQVCLCESMDYEKNVIRWWVEPADAEGKE